MQSGVEQCLFVGLGNPGPRYATTRHNIGSCVIEELSRRLSLPLREDRRFVARVAKGESEGKRVHLLIPLTYMNLSGTAVQSYSAYFSIGLQSLVVVVDDVAFPFGCLRLRLMGSAGGHNGLKSVEQSMGSSHYKRLRMGIGQAGEKVLADYVLETFNEDEQAELSQFVDRGVEVLQRLLRERFSDVMTSVNARA